MRCNLFLAVIFLTLITGAASALETSSGGSLAPGDHHAGSLESEYVVLDFPPLGFGTFPPDHNLVIMTRLEKPEWTYSLILDGIKGPGRTVAAEKLILNGSELNHSVYVKQSLYVNLNGTVPDVSRETMLSIMYIYETDTNGKIVPEASRSDHAIRIYPAGTTTGTSPASATIPPTPVLTQVPATRNGSLMPFVIVCGKDGTCRLVGPA